MLPSTARITKDKEFDLIFKKGQTYFCPLFTAKYLLTKTGRFRLGVIIGKSKMAKAVDRNLYKRRVRAVFQEIISLLPKNCDIVIIGKAGANKQSYTVLKQEIQKFLNKKRIVL
jgi:ribonuclease P protein component